MLVINLFLLYLDLKSVTMRKSLRTVENAAGNLNFSNATEQVEIVAD